MTSAPAQTATGPPAGYEKRGSIYLPVSMREHYEQQKRRESAHRHRTLLFGGASGAGFDGSRENRWTQDWLHPETEPIGLITAYQRKMRDRARSLARNAPWFVSILNTWVDNVVGEGFPTLQAQTYSDEFGETLDDQKNHRIEQIWKWWSRAVDIDRRESLTMFLRTSEREYAEVGEYFTIMRTVNDGHTLPLALQLVPSEQCPADYNRPAGRTEDGRTLNRISNGIEFDAIGRRVAYYFTEFDAMGIPVAGRYTRVPADRVQHRYLKLRAGQQRGVPPLFAAMLLCYDFDSAIEYEMDAWQAQSRLMGKLKHAGAGRELPQGPGDDVVDERRVFDIAGALIVELRNTEELDFTTPTHPNDKLEPWVTFASRTLGKTVGLSYEATTGDYSKVNFASGRLGALADRKTFRRHQSELDHIDLRPIYSEFLWLAVTSGRVPEIDVLELLTEPERFTEHKFVYSGWEHHDPMKEAVAAGIRMALGLSTLADETAALGKDWEKTLAQLGREIEARMKHGVPMVHVGGAQAVTGTGDGGNPGFTTDDNESDDSQSRAARTGVNINELIKLATSIHEAETAEQRAAEGGNN